MFIVMHNVILLMSPLASAKQTQSNYLLQNIGLTSRIKSEKFLPLSNTVINLVGVFVHILITVTAICMIYI